LYSIQAERRRLEAEIDDVATKIDPDAMKYMESLRSEMTDAYSERPTLTMALLELTRTVGHDAWCQSLEWRDGSVTVQLKEDQEDVDLVRALEFSPVLGDVVQISKAVGPTGDSVRRFQMNARYDIPGEKRPETPSAGAGEPEAEGDRTDTRAVPATGAEAGDADAEPADATPADEKPDEESPGQSAGETGAGETQPIPPPPPPPAPAGGF
jgi:hypothetical protein